MLDPRTFGTLFHTFESTVARFGERPAYMVPAMQGRPYHPNGRTWTWREAADEIAERRAWYAAAGYGPGHRVAILFEQHPEFVFHLFALNALGVSVVPLNPEHRPDEFGYVLGHSRATLALATANRLDDITAAVRDLATPPAVRLFDDRTTEAPTPRGARRDAELDGATEAGILYTSGTTGRPKGCLLTNEYFHTFGLSFVNRGGLLALGHRVERLYNPLPLHHANAFAISLPATLITGNCFVFPDRFHASTWWDDMHACGITAVQFQGVIPNILMKLPSVPREREHTVRFALCAGVEPSHHAAFEARYGFPIIEMWAMSETGRIIAAHEEPRMIKTRAFGRNYPGFEGRIVDADDNEVPDGTPGQFVVRNSAAEPRRGFCAGYLDNPEATETAWRNGWFHTGDVATRGPDGMFFFVERANNIIRRAGENIAAAEIEACLVAHPGVRQVAVIAVVDDVREEEVMACVVPHDGTAADDALAHDIVAWSLARLAAFKAPGWIIFRESLPTTSSQKVRKVQLFPPGVDPRFEDGARDVRALKSRTKVAR